MKKIIRLTESDLARIVKRVIKENQEEKIADKVAEVIELPKVEMKIEDIYSNLSDEDKMNFKMVLDNLGIDENSTAKEVHDAIETEVGNEISGEIGENESTRNKASEILHAIGAGNIAAWGGVPAAIAIGGLLAGTVGAPMAAGFAISWGATALLMGLAKLLKDDSPSLNSSNRKQSHSNHLRRMRPDDTYEDEPEMDPEKNRAYSGEKEGSVFYRNSKGEKIYSKMEDGEELPQGYKRTMGENYRRRQYRRRY